MSKIYFTETRVVELARNAYETDSVDFDIVGIKCALLVIDMQDEFVKPNWTPYWVPEATRQVPIIKELIQFCRQNHISVIYTAFANTYNYLDRPKTGDLMPNRYKNKIDEADPSWFTRANIWQEISPTGQEIVILKPSYGAFF